jgi:hypothetical protein
MCRVHPSGVNREKGQDIVADNVRPHAGNYRPPLGTVLRPWKELIPRLRKVFYACRELRGTAEYLPNLACRTHSWASIDRGNPALDRKKMRPTKTKE